MRILAKLLISIAAMGALPSIAAKHCNRDFRLVAEHPEGMSATLRPDLGLFGVAGDTYRLTPCNRDAMMCFSSDYMSFAAPSSATVMHWENAQGVVFDRAGSMKIKVAGSDVAVDLIFSTQKLGNFLFYYNESNGLVGWQATAVDANKLWAEEYVADKL